MTYRILFIALASPDFYRSSLITDCSQIFIGPDVNPASNHFDGSFGSFYLGPDLLDCNNILRLINSLNWVPDYVFVKADATRRNHVFNLDRLPGVKILLLGDTHHCLKPISTMLNYARSERWDFITSEHDLHHLSFFYPYFSCRILHLPCFTINPFQLPPLDVDNRDICFVGSVTTHHWYRSFIIKAMTLSGFQISLNSCSQINAAKLYQSSFISLNISLNSDFNFRVFEILSSGGCLITDRLGPDSLINEYLIEGVHYLGYSCLEELIDIVQNLRNSPTIRNQIAIAGFNHFWTNLSPICFEKNLLRSLIAP